MIGLLLRILVNGKIRLHNTIPELYFRFSRILFTGLLVSARVDKPTIIDEIVL